MRGKPSAVEVRILGKPYRIRSDADPEMVRRAAALVDETIERVRGRTRTVDSLDVAVLSALNLANLVVALREGREDRVSSVDAARLGELIALVEAAVDGPAPSAS